MTAIHTPAATASAAGTARDQTTNTSDLIDRARRLVPVIREHADGMERQRRVAKPVFEALASAGFQGLFAPRSLKGLEVDPLIAFRVVEEIALVDSTAAWDH